jgi:hypothetical protein
MGARRGWCGFAGPGLLDCVVQRGDEGRGRGGIRWVAVGGQVDASPEVAQRGGLDSGADPGRCAYLL